MGGFAGEEGLDELEVADGDGVEFEGGGSLVEAGGVEVFEGSCLVTRR